MRVAHRGHRQRAQTEVRARAHRTRGYLCIPTLTPARERASVLRAGCCVAPSTPLKKIVHTPTHSYTHTTYKPIYGQKVHHTQRDDRNGIVHTAVNNHGPRTEHVLSPALPRRIHNMGYGTAFARGPPLRKKLKQIMSDVGAVCQRWVALRVRPEGECRGHHLTGSTASSCCRRTSGRRTLSRGARPRSRRLWT